MRQSSQAEKLEELRSKLLDNLVAALPDADRHELEEAAGAVLEHVSPTPPEQGDPLRTIIVSRPGPEGSDIMTIKPGNIRFNWGAVIRACLPIPPAAYTHDPFLIVFAALQLILEIPKGFMVRLEREDAMVVVAVGKLGRGEAAGLSLDTIHAEVNRERGTLGLGNCAKQRVKSALDNLEKLKCVIHRSDGGYRVNERSFNCPW